MSRQRQDQLLSALLREESWVTAASLADALGVTPRSIRSYVVALNARVAATDAVESGPAGYRAGPGAHAALQQREAGEATPRDRLHTLVRALLDAEEGVDVYETAERLHVSEATLESDLGRVRGLLAGTGLTLVRDRAIVRLRGEESAQRRLLSRLAHDEMESRVFSPDAFRRALLGSTAAEAVGPFKAALVRRLGELGYYVNELAIADVLLHIAIATERVAAGHALAATGADDGEVVQGLADAIAELVVVHFGVELGRGDRAHLARLVLTRVVAPDESAPAVAARAGLEPAVEEAVRAEVAQAAEDYDVDVNGEEFILRLALHVQNLLRRAREQAWSRNPLTRDLKSAYPMIFEVAVSIASGLNRRLGVPLNEDEIAYIAMHVGGRLERNRRAASMLTATIVCPGYYELHELLRSSVDRSLGQSIEVTGVETRVDPDWSAIDTDLVLTTIDPGAPGENIVRIQTFLTDADVERVQQAAARIRRSRRLTRLREELSRYFDGSAFVSPLPDIGEEELIRLLGEPLREAGLIDQDYIENSIERERMSSTAFTDALAVPHALQMTARRTALSVGVADGSVRWGDGRVQVVVLAAFSESDRPAFQTVFEQFVEVFSERDSVQRIIRRGTTFHGFLDELVAVIDG